MSTIESIGPLLNCYPFQDHKTSWPTSLSHPKTLGVLPLLQTAKLAHTRSWVSPKHVDVVCCLLNVPATYRKPQGRLKTFSLFQFQFYSSSRWHRSARKGPYTLRSVSQQSPQGCNRNGANICVVEHRSFSTLEGGVSIPSILHSSFLQAINAVMLWPVHVQIVPQASEHLSPVKLQTRCDICCCACQFICPFIPTDSGVPMMVPIIWLTFIAPYCLNTPFRLCRRGSPAAPSPAAGNCLLHLHVQPALVPGDADARPGRPRHPLPLSTQIPGLVFRTRC